MVEPLERPAAPRSLSERVRAWVEWFGIGRLVATSMATVIVCAGGVWLVRTPPPATEASLPRAATTSSPAEPEPPTVPTVPVSATVVLVHVAGAVAEPGVYQLVGDARVRDAIIAAGGPTDLADSNALNLAASVADGVRVYVPVIGEAVPATHDIGAASAGADQPPGLPVDVNAAGASELERLPGVGPATAAAIVTDRERNGPFLDVDDLDRVPGIGPAKLDALRDLVTT